MSNRQWEQARTWAKTDVRYKKLEKSQEYLKALLAQNGRKLKDIQEKMDNIVNEYYDNNPEWKKNI